MSQNAGSEEAERHGTRFSALFLGILSTQSRMGPGCLATVSKKSSIPSPMSGRCLRLLLSDKLSRNFQTIDLEERGDLDLPVWKNLCANVSF